jgi:hypothetical protein
MNMPKNMSEAYRVVTQLRDDNKKKDERIAELKDVIKTLAKTRCVSYEDLAKRDLEQQAKGIEAAIDAALDLDLIENDVHVCNSIKEQAKAKVGAD